MYHAVTCLATQQDAYILRYLGEKVCSHVLPWSVSLINASAGHAGDLSSRCWRICLCAVKYDYALCLIK